MSVTVDLMAFELAARLVQKVDEDIETAALIAVNETVVFVKREAKKELGSQVNFEPGYLEDRIDAHKATRDTLTGSVSTQDRPTSLARFVRGTPRRGQRATVAVSRRGGIKQLKGAFLVRLRSGRTLSEDKFNKGLAIRLKPGDALRERRKGTGGLPEIFPNVFLLYGPSTGQVFNTARTDLVPRASNYLEAEFIRQFKRLKGARRG